MYSSKNIFKEQSTTFTILIILNDPLAYYHYHDLLVKFSVFVNVCVLSSQSIVNVGGQWSSSYHVTERRINPIVEPLQEKIITTTLCKANLLTTITFSHMYTTFSWSGWWLNTTHFLRLCKLTIEYEST